MTDHIFQFFQLIVHTIFSGILDTSIGNNKVYNIIYIYIYATNAKLRVMLVHCGSDDKNFLTPNGRSRNLNVYVSTVMEVFGKSSYSTFTVASEVAQ